jgi:hypothetical protein
MKMGMEESVKVSYLAETLTHLIKTWCISIF